MATYARDEWEVGDRCYVRGGYWTRDTDAACTKRTAAVVVEVMRGAAKVKLDTGRELTARFNVIEPDEHWRAECEKKEAEKRARIAREREPAVRLVPSPAAPLTFTLEEKLMARDDDADDQPVANQAQRDEALRQLTALRQGNVMAMAPVPTEAPAPFLPAPSLAPPPPEAPVLRAHDVAPEAPESKSTGGRLRGTEPWRLAWKERLRREAEIGEKLRLEDEARASTLPAPPEPEPAPEPEAPPSPVVIPSDPMGALFARIQEELLALYGEQEDVEKRLGELRALEVRLTEIKDRTRVLAAQERQVKRVMDARKGDA
jgi:hypothetical protein